MSGAAPPPAAIGAGVGMFTVVWFTVLHQLLISDIWFSFVPMLAAGAACGGCLAWNYGVLFDTPSASTWAAFIGFHLAGLLALGGVSVVMFEPVVPFAVVVAANEPPTELIRRALPLTGAFILGVAALASVLWGRTPAKFAANLATSFVLIVLLGLNVSALGLVQLTSDAVGVVAEFLGLVALIMVGYGGVFLAVERRRFRAGSLTGAE